jgi:hypothetical protein
MYQAECLLILPAKERHRVEKFLFEEVPGFRRISEIPNINLKDIRIITE